MSIKSYGVIFRQVSIFPLHIFDDPKLWGFEMDRLLLHSCEIFRIQKGFDDEVDDLCAVLAAGTNPAVTMDLINEIDGWRSEAIHEMQAAS